MVATTRSRRPSRPRSWHACSMTPARPCRWLGTTAVTRSPPTWSRPPGRGWRSCVRRPAPRPCHEPAPGSEDAPTASWSDSTTQHPPGMAQEEEQVERVRRGRLELAVMQVEVSRHVVTGGDEQRADVHMLGDHDRAPQRIDEQPPPQAVALL